jgi:hypothetical protein
MIDRKTAGLIRQAIRSVYFRSLTRLEALKKVEDATPAMKLDGSPKERAGKQMYTRRYTCEMCGKTGLKSTEVAVDHKIAVGPSVQGRNAPDDYTWDEFIGRLFCSADKLQVICNEPCHSDKTKKDREEIANGEWERKWREEKIKG